MSFQSDITEQIKHWDDTWQGRIIDTNHVMMNKPKMRFILSELKKRPYYKNLKILEVGCGTGVHVMALKQDWPELVDNWTGIDLSMSAVKFAKSKGLNAHLDDIYSMDTDQKFEAFWFLDVLEHIEHHDILAQRINELAADDFYIFGNIPLYCQTPTHGPICERSIGRVELSLFLGNCHIKGFWQRIYGSYGYPYMIFEAHKGAI